MHGFARTSLDCVAQTAHPPRDHIEVTPLE